MRYGLFMMPLHPPEKDPNRAYFDDIELLIRADEFGFGEAWIGEHLTAQWESIPTPDLLIANVLPRTKQIASPSWITWPRAASCSASAPAASPETSRCTRSTTRPASSAS